MDFLFAATTLLALSLLLLFLRSRNRGHDHGDTIKNVPEAKGWWPVIGHLHLLAVKVPAYRVLGNMADKYGPIFMIRLGRRPTLVVSSWEIAKECLATHDKAFLGRPQHNFRLVYEGGMFGLGPYGQYWRNMRRISTHELLSNTRLELLKSVRSAEVKACIKHLFSLCRSGPAKVEMCEWSSIVILNFLTQMIAGKRCSLEKEDVESRRFIKSMEEFMLQFGLFCVSDVLPFAERMDLQGHFRAMKRAMKECDKYANDWFLEHIEKWREGKVKEEDQDFIDVMLTSLENDPSLSDPYSMEVAIKSTVLNLVIGGAETTTVGVTWILSLLVNHPEVIKKAQNEIDTYVGKKRWVEESDMKNLVYLTAILKESLRLYVPLSVPRESIEDCTIAGHHIPKGTDLIVNIWKIHHDPRVWSNPNEFQPERFLSDDHAHLDIRGQDSVFIPFGYGRRSCPGMTSASQMALLVIARLLQGFNLATPDGRKVDMTPGLGLTNARATPLELILTPRLPHELY